MEETYSLLELNKHLKQVIALNFPEPIWVKAEIVQSNLARKHRYLELVQKEPSGDISARASAVLWAGRQARLFARMQQDPSALLQAGQEVRLLVRVDFHEQYGLKLIVENLDEAFTLGQLEKQRLETLAKLQAMGLMDQNSRLPVPMVLQRIAVISSPTAAGWEDFRHQLAHNPHGLSFRLSLFPASVQGLSAEAEIVEQIEQIARDQEKFDVLVLIRGGGSRLDLSVFDRFLLSKAVAECPLPVLSGIGHEIDTSVVDGVAHTALKTPTAVAEFLIERNLQFLIRIQEAGALIRDRARAQTEGEHQRLREMQFTLEKEAVRTLAHAGRLLDFIRESSLQRGRQAIREASLQLTALEKEIEGLDPATVLSRGYALVLKQGKPLRSSREVAEKELLEVRLHQGRLRVNVQERDTGDS
jgi:exodeoxyribonuclease VII large subunit